MVETSMTSIQPRCGKCGHELGSSYLYSTDGFTYHHECYPLSPTQVQLASLQRQISEAQSENAYLLETITRKVNEKIEAERQLSEAVEQRDDYLNKALMADLDRQAAEAEVARLKSELRNDQAELSRLMKAFTDAIDAILSEIKALAAKEVEG